MTLPSTLYLRHRDGPALGPLTPRVLEALYDGRLIDEATPVSVDGRAFGPLSDRPDLVHHLRQVKERLVRGEDAWTPEGAPARAATTGPAAPALDGEVAVVRALLSHAAGKSTGHLHVAGGQGDVTCTFREGKVVAVATADPSLDLPRFLLAQGVVGEAALQDARARAPTLGGDLGAALIAGGAVQPHVYFEKLVAWATSAVAAAVGRDRVRCRFEPSEVPSPPVPLGFDRLGLVIEAVRQGLPKARLAELWLPRRGCPVVLSAVEGVALEDCKLQPRELRALNAVDGKKSVGDLLEAFGSGEEAQGQVLRALHFAERAGFVVLGEDPNARIDAAEIAELDGVRRQLAGRNAFDRLGVTERSSDDEVRARYADLAKKYHPDKARPGATEALIEARRQAFALVTEAFEAVDTEDKRYRYRSDLDRGLVAGEDDARKVQEVMQAETLFKKAEILAKVKKIDEALRHLDEALRLKPDEVEFKVYRAYLEYQSARGGGEGEVAAEAAAAKIQALIKGQPPMVSAIGFLAQLAKAQGKAEVAVRHYERLLELDPNHVEAARELRIANLRKDKQSPKKKWF